MSDLKNVLEFILVEINKENESRDDGTTMSKDLDNQILINIFYDASIKYEFDEDLIDDEDLLSAAFGGDGYDAIREAEQGIY